MMQSLLCLNLRSQVVLQSLLCQRKSLVHKVVLQSLPHVSRSGAGHKRVTQGHAQDAHSVARQTKEIRPSADSCSLWLDVTRAVKKDVRREILVVNLQVAAVKLMPMLTLETTSRTWRARETFR